MTPDEWQQVKDILHEAWERDPSERAAFLDETCAGDAELRRHVEALLASDQSAGEFLSEPLPGPLFGHSAESLSGRRIGPYQILREIGHGGMGTVYLAERADGQYRKRVAIKLIKPGLGTEAIVRRFPQRAPGSSRSGSPQHRPASGWRRYRRWPSLFGDGLRGRRTHRHLV